MIAHLLLGDKAQVFGSDGNLGLSHFSSDFLYNKALGLRANSFTKLNNKLNGIRLHDRLVQGGNGTIWGGFIDIALLSNEHLALFEKSSIAIKNLTYMETGSCSPDHRISQLHFPEGRTLNPAQIIKNISTGYLESFQILSDSSIQLLVRQSGLPKEDAISIYAKGKVVLAIGVVQFIDLLYRSHYLKDDDVIELSEFGYSLKVCLKSKKLNSESRVIRVCLLRGLLHYLGIQHYPKIFSFMDRYIPIVFEQAFGFERFSAKIYVRKGSLECLSKVNDYNFGKSIHYCNLRINGISANEFLRSISANIVGLGMAFVDQPAPGPISNDILIDAIEKIQREK